MLSVVVFLIGITHVVMHEDQTCTSPNSDCLRISEAKEQAGPWSKPTCAPGRHTIVHLFEWKWTDIAAECERFLGPKGYCGVQVSPPNENRVVTTPNRPWWERYQPVSYKLVTRSGNDAQFQDMVQRCNKVNVRIYVDAVINHMTGASGQGTGTGGSHWDGGAMSYPEVPFQGEHFNGQMECGSHDLNIHDYNNATEVRNCRLVSLADLNLRKEHVRNRIAKYMNRLIEFGVAGFRIDAAKHMWPCDLKAIYQKLNNSIFPDGGKPFIFQEVIDMGGNTEAIRADEYTKIARVTNFIYGIKLAEVFRRQNEAKWLQNWGKEWGMPASDEVVVFIDNHDNQRGHGGRGDVLTHKEPKLYKMATAFMLAHPYGFTQVMSSFRFESPDEGPPHNDDMFIRNVPWKPENFECADGWVCEHRWRQIYNMVAFRNMVAGTAVEHWWSHDKYHYQIGFSRGNKGFFLLNADISNLYEDLQTGLPQGTYCDVISGNYDNEKEDCTGFHIEVNNSGYAHFEISSGSEDPVIAIHTGARKKNPEKLPWK